MRNYCSSFQMRCSTEDFSTEWHRLEVGIAAGCTISVIWFILVMEMLLRSTDCSEETAKVRAPKKAFMDDVTLLTRETETMQKVLNQLNELITWSRMKFKAKKIQKRDFPQRETEATQIHYCWRADAYDKRRTSEKFRSVVC